ncbi:MAG: hypothetical protein WAN33_07650 [Candidatus Acidiferrales bacterium]
MDIGLQFDVIYKAEDLIQVRVSAWNGSFGGTVDIYAGFDCLEEIAAELQGFPASVSDSREIKLGALGPKSAGGVEMRFYCTDASGHAYVGCKMDSGILSGKSAQSVNLSLPIEAAAVDSFVGELRTVGVRRMGIARLEGVPAAVRS